MASCASLYCFSNPNNSQAVPAGEFDFSSEEFDGAQEDDSEEEDTQTELARRPYSIQQ